MTLDVHHGALAHRHTRSAEHPPSDAGSVPDDASPGIVSIQMSASPSSPALSDIPKFKGHLLQASLPVPAASAVPAAAPAMQQISMFNAAPDIYKTLVAIGEAKLQQSYFKLAVMGLLAGFYVSFGFSFCAATIGLMGNTIYGALAFPTGLLLIVLCGAELFTGNTCYMFTANIEGKANFWHHQKIIWSAYFWNLVGSLIIVGLQLGGDVWTGREDFVHNIAQKKMQLTWANVVCRAIIANWLVNLAVYQSFAARDVIGKAIGVWTPITCFVAIGLEHCIANMWVIPMSIYLAPTAKWPETITWANFIAKNLIPATIGNWIGGAIMVGAFSAACYGENIPKWKDAAWDNTLGRAYNTVDGDDDDDELNPVDGRAAF